MWRLDCECDRNYYCTCTKKRHLIMLNARSEFILDEQPYRDTSISRPNVIRLEAKKWYHLCFRQSSKGRYLHEQELWVNGILVVKSNLFYSGVSYIDFAHHDGLERYFADIRLWNRCLTKVEVCAIAANGSKALDCVNVSEFLFDEVLAAIEQAARVVWSFNCDHRRVTNEAIDYAISRAVSLPPFSIRLKWKSSVKFVIKEILDHFNNYHRMNIELSTAYYSRQHANHLLIFPSNYESFCYLYNDNLWPSRLNGQEYTLGHKPDLPAQLTLIVHNIDLDESEKTLLNEWNYFYPKIVSVTRMKDKYGEQSKSVKIGVLSEEIYNELVRQRSIALFGIFKLVEPLVTAAEVLLCSKCLQIGHFHWQCTFDREVCKTCGASCLDWKQHRCMKPFICVRCGNDSHELNDTSCQNIIEYRHRLTDILRNLSGPWSSTDAPPSADNTSYNYSPADFPLLPNSTLNTTRGIIAIENHVEIPLQK